MTERSHHEQHIVVVIHHLTSGGAQRQALEFSSDLVERGNRVTVYTFEGEREERGGATQNLAREYPHLTVIQAHTNPLLQALIELRHQHYRRTVKRNESMALHHRQSLHYLSRTPRLPGWLSNTKPGRLALRLFLGANLNDHFSHDTARAIAKQCAMSPSFAVHVRGLARFVARQRPTHIVSFLTKANCVSLVVGNCLNVPVTVSERNDVLAQPPGKGLGLLRMALYPHALRITANTQFATEDLSKLFPGVELAWFPNSRRYRSGQNMQVRLPSPHVCVVSRLEPQKRIGEVIRAFGIAPLSDTAAHLHVFGSGSEKEPLRRLTKVLGLDHRVTFHGFVSAKEIPFNECGIVVSNSLYEGSANSLHEAVQRGLLPVIANSVREVADIVPEKTLDLLRTDGSAESLSHVIGGLLSSPATRERLTKEVHGAFAVFWEASDKARKTFVDAWGTENR